MATAKREFSMMSLLLIPIGIALNFVLGSVAKALNLPIFLDSVGTVLAAILGGPIVGGITGLLGVLSISAFAPAAVVWSLQAGVIGIVVGLLARFGWFRGSRVILSTLIIVGLSVLLSAIISIAVFGGFDGYGISVIRAALIEAGFNMPTAVVITSAVAELIDKSLSVAIPMLVIGGMSDRFLNKFPNGPHLRTLRPQAGTVGTGRVAPQPATPVVSDSPLDQSAVDETDTYGSYGSYDEPTSKS